ncbi:hypothetical protein CHLNCDRAFT_139017 [Chlorella variabilis]|uniref:Transmembrane protein 50A n=1 Tax=Chlorella variabilis TaxID=554065 RepID=E1ZPL8_CHLVA|nr:hypothetical protein CHLNCDRAFT_139017 [Chlorella variabilis]EFN52202.1 hypothetical protein CHLNCDRAFT_139017 [Chlorella variabilis]|eukprot:XP_005844304.1 hypothetical protein CHLNCDRAFT_139017 [Chlorella variabilis]
MPGFNLAKWFIEGEVDWDYYNEQLRQWGPVAAGALFGAGWWCWADALVYQQAVVGEPSPFKYNWPGIVATIALVCINMLPRRDLAEAGEAWEEGGEFRARLWLFLSFLVAAGAVAGSVAVLLAATSATQTKDLSAVGVGSVLQCGLILAASTLLWAFRSGEGDSSGYMMH